MIPINPGARGKKILKRTVHASLREVPGTVDMVNIFRPRHEVYRIVEEILSVYSEKKLRIIWMQLGVRDDEAAAMAERVGLTVVMNRCPKIEYSRLHGELSWNGFNSRLLSSKSRPANNC